MGIFRRGSDTASDTDLLTRPELEEDDGGHDRFSHYVKKEKIVESAVTGKSVKALCGKKWIPSRDPQKYPICPACKEIHDGLREAPEEKWHEKTETISRNTFSNSKHGRIYATSEREYTTSESFDGLDSLLLNE